MTNKNLEKHHDFMKYALRLGNHALHHREVPVACIFVYNDEIISYGMNSTNDSLSGIKHAEFKGIEEIISKVVKIADYQTIYLEPKDIFKHIDLYVTVEPCVMCASALKQIGIRQVFFGCGNERFGGNGSVFRINKDQTSRGNDYHSYPGIYRKESILLLRDFYTRENGKAPEPRSKKNRVLKTEDFPDLKWDNYVSKDEFIEFYGKENLQAFEDSKDLERDVNEDLFNTILTKENDDISDIEQRSKKPLELLNKKQKI